MATDEKVKELDGIVLEYLRYYGFHTVADGYESELRGAKRGMKVRNIVCKH
jgi:hypothetical protein